ncbi:acyltransferase family protein [Sphingobium sp. CAP-1]|uniref:acyltransferase family protein n=1 Tax=Sphingobium sp. CAP-1 TaxID=2676077 RepID=UPI0012BB2418|nr:acyltransferase [Sphingobium sp. CAP-1]QGP79679.1 acyltransferase family protein [Sphingobium sp. CAP-1]
MRFRSIHSLRGMAAMMVVLYHLHSTGIVTGVDHALYGWLVGGVDIFFLISGFVMVESTRGKAIRPGAFMMARIRRVVPVYWLFSILLLNSLPGQSLYKLASFLFIPVVRADGVTHPLLNPGWTLNYEMGFYALFALSLFLPDRWRFPALGSVLALLGASHYVAPLPGLLSYYSSPFVWEFLIGMGIARLAPGGHPLLVPAGLLWMAVSHSWIADPFFSLAPGATMVVIGSLSLEGRMPDIPVLRRLGDASYMLYLSHMFTFSLLAMLHLPAALTIVAALIAAPLAAMLLHRTIERPLMAMGRSRSGRQTDRPATSNISSMPGSAGISSRSCA